MHTDPEAGLLTRVSFQLRASPNEPPSSGECLHLKGRAVPLALVRNSRARRYVLSFRADGSVRVTIPPTGTILEGRRFAEEQGKWIERQLRKMDSRPVAPAQWFVGSEIYFRGELVRLELTGENSRAIQFGSEVLPLPDAEGGLRQVVESRLRQLATAELPARVFELASLHGFRVKRVAVRNQRTRWGSCSRRSGISLNWRLIQTPPSVADYIIIHELCHLRQMNHSYQFWREVQSLCPMYPVEERWLKDHSHLLMLPWV